MWRPYITFIKDPFVLLFTFYLFLNFLMILKICKSVKNLNFKDPVVLVSGI